MDVALAEELPEPRELVLEPEPGVSVQYDTDSVVLDVDYGLRASKLVSSVGLLVPAEARLRRSTRRGARVILTFALATAGDSTRGETA